LFARRRGLRKGEEKVSIQLIFGGKGKKEEVPGPEKKGFEQGGKRSLYASKKSGRIVWLSEETTVGRWH